MVRINRDNKMRVSENFVDFTKILGQELKTIKGKQVSSREITDEITSFMYRENLTNILLRQAKNKRKRLF